MGSGPNRDDVLNNAGYILSVCSYVLGTQVSRIELPSYVFQARAISPEPEGRTDVRKDIRSDIWTDGQNIPCIREILPLEPLTIRKSENKRKAGQEYC